MKMKFTDRWIRFVVNNVIVWMVKMKKREEKEYKQEVHEGMFLFLFPPKVVKTNVRKAKGDGIGIACACKQRMNCKEKK